jgi:hypothetical protein
VTSSVPVTCACCCIQYTPVRWTGDAAPIRIRCDLWHPCYNIGCSNAAIRCSKVVGSSKMGSSASGPLPAWWYWSSPFASPHQSHRYKKFTL